ncbi:MAG: outer membrane beta-barrel protein [Bacteroidota bacterium]
MKRTGLLLFFLFNLFMGFAQAQKDTITEKRGVVSVELAVNACFGGGSNNAGNAELTNLSYEMMLNRAGKVDTVNYKIGAGLTGSFEINLMFGKKRNVGFSAGAMIISGFNSFNLDSFGLQYKATDKEGRNFKRILRAYEWKERVTYTNISIPVLLKFRHQGKKKVGFFADIGPVVSLLSNAKSRIETVVDFEAIYSTQGGSPHFSEQTESTDWLITREMIKQHISSGNPNDYFAQQYNRGYYVGLDKPKTGKAPTIDYKIGFGGLLRVGMIYNVTPLFSITLGGQCLIISSGRKTTDSYKPLEVADDFEKEGDVNSMLNSTGSLLKAQYGINLGFHLKVVK